MRMDPDCLARDSTGLYELDTGFATAQVNTSFGGSLQTWWQRFSAPRAARLRPVEPDLCLPFADTEATWCRR